jgi:hypothetical protein
MCGDCENQQLRKEVRNDGIAKIPVGLLMPVARPLQSPRLVARKRPVDADFPDLPLAKCPKLDAPLVQSPQKCAVLGLEEDVSLRTECAPATPTRQSRPLGDGMTPKSVRRPALAALDTAVQVAIDLYKEVWTYHALEEQCGPAPHGDARENRADAVCEQWAANNHDAMHKAVVALLPWVGDLEPAAATVGADYDVLRFRGVTPPRSLLCHGCETFDEEVEKVLKQLKWLRSSSAENRAREALITLCAALSCRVEKCWLEGYLSELNTEVNKSGLRRSKSQKMKNLTNSFVADMIKKEEWCCQFARALVTPSSSIWMSFARGVGNPLPASLIVAHRIPLWEVFVKLEGENPIRGEARKKEWWAQAGRQLAFQEVSFEEGAEGSRNDRQLASNLKPDPRLRDLIRSKKRVVYLDMLAALAPRELSKQHRLSNIIKAELTKLFREAKARGDAVVFVLGSDNPRKLAQAVYLRPPLQDFGLRCGFFRWRESADVSWAREKELDSRTLMMLQMP